MKILVPTDFSKNAQKAIDYAVKIAEKSVSEIILLHAYQIIDTESPTRKFLFDEYNRSIARKLHDELKVQRNRITKINPGIKVTAELSDNGTKKSINEASIGKDFIVMGTQGASGLKKIFMGSTTASIIGNAAVPVLAIPRSYKWREPKNILLATNQFETDQNILKDLFQLVRLFKARLHVIIFTDSDTSDEEDYLNHKKELGNYQNVLEERY
jgi:nucleotide-binding universal stress UspA family protein